ncbi:hypothetical protein TNCV_3380221 [Trichonephila clavipes]|nr:hypothetical protein TNCV_3380221 [Trichonephila clavipes]
MNTEISWELNTGGFASDRPPDRNICSCTSGSKVANTKLGTGSCPSWAVAPLSYACDFKHITLLTATAGSDVVQSGRPILVDFFQHLGPYIGHNTANGIFQMVKRLWLIRIDQ